MYAYCRAHPSKRSMKACQVYSKKPSWLPSRIRFCIQKPCMLQQPRGDRWWKRVCLRRLCGRREVPQPCLSMPPPPPYSPTNAVTACSSWGWTRGLWIGDAPWNATPSTRFSCPRRHQNCSRCWGVITGRAAQLAPSESWGCAAVPEPASLPPALP